MRRLALVFLSGDGVPGAASRLAYAARQRVSRACCFFCYLQLFFASFVVDLDALVEEDLRHESPDLPEASRSRVA